MALLRRLSRSDRVIDFGMVAVLLLHFLVALLFLQALLLAQALQIRPPLLLLHHLVRLELVPPTLVQLLQVFVYLARTKSGVRPAHLVRLWRPRSRWVLYPSHHQVQVLHAKLVGVPVVQVLKVFEGCLAVHNVSCR